MRITKKALGRLWVKATLGALAAGALVGYLEFSLSRQTGYSTLALQTRAHAIDYFAVFFEWTTKGVPVQRVLLNWAVDFVFMGLYAAAFFYSGVIVREALAPRPGRLRRLLVRLTAVPVAGALLDAIENVLEAWQYLSGPTDALAQIASNVSIAKYAAFFVGLVFLAGAGWIQVYERQKSRLKALSEAP